MCRECSGGEYSLYEAKESLQQWQYWMSPDSSWFLRSYQVQTETLDDKYRLYPFDTYCQRKVWKTHYGHKGRERMLFNFSTSQLMRQQDNCLKRIEKLYDDGGMPDGAKLYRIAKELLRRQLDALRGTQ